MRSLTPTAGRSSGRRHGDDDERVGRCVRHRALDRLPQGRAAQRTPLLVEGVRFDSDGDHAAEYTRGATDATIELGDDGVTLTVDDSAADPVSAAFDTTSVSAD